MTQDDLMQLGAGRWAVPLLATLHAQAGAARFAVLLSLLSVPRDSLVRTLGHAVDCGWVKHNAGYGHPLRPEYLLTRRGRSLAGSCAALMAARRTLGLTPQDLPRWSLPILARLAQADCRFSDLLVDLSPVTPRALSLNLKQMAEATIITRILQDGFPPTTLYSLAKAGRLLCASLSSYAAKE